MSIESHFNNIKKEILQNIKSAEKSIFGAIAWLTDKELMNVLYTKAIKGIKIDLIISDDQENIKYLEFHNNLKRAGVQIHVYNKAIGLMHHKFCIIDNETLIMGSYNWTFSAANYNNESIVIIKNENEIIKNFKEEFNSLKITNYKGSNIQLVNTIVQKDGIKLETTQRTTQRNHQKSRSVRMSATDYTLALVPLDNINIFWIENALFTKNILSRYYPINDNLLEKYKDIWDWKGLSLNRNLPWSIELIEKYKDKWDWLFLSMNTELSWSFELIEKYKDKWSRLSLSNNSGLPWSLTLFLVYKDYLIGFPSNISINWYKYLIKNYFYDISICTDLSRNNSLPWSIEFIEKNNNIWDWSSLSLNKSLPWNLKLIETFSNKLNWGNLSMNEKLPWSENFIEEYLINWNWDNLSRNEQLPWNENFIEKYFNNWNWDNLSRNEQLPWNENFIEKYFNNWNWDKISLVRKIPWSIELIKRFKDKWNWKYMDTNSSIYANLLEPFLTDKSVEEVMQKIISKK